MEEKVEIPIQLLDPETLTAVIESFILREGTNYGDVEFSLETKTQQIRDQLSRGTVKLVFDPEVDSPTLITSNEFQCQKTN